MPKVSIVTRTKSRPFLLARALASVLGQEFVDWQHIIVNDGGDPDGVEALCAAERERYGNRLRILHHAESKGMEAASNAGIRASDGELLVIHDDDDSWEPAFLSACVEYLNTNAQALIGGVITHTKRVIEEIHGDQIRCVSEDPFNTWMKGVSLFRMAAGNTFPPISFVFKRSVWEQVGAFREDLPVLGDWDFHFRVLLEYEIGLVPRVLARYHHRRSLMTGSYSNTVIGADDQHRRYEIMLRNEWLRADLRRGQLGPGFLLQISRAVEELSGVISNNQRETLFAYIKDKVYEWGKTANIIRNKG